MMNPVHLHRVSRWLWLHRMRPAAVLVQRLLAFLCSCDIPPDCTIGMDVIIPHFGLGICIYPNARIGDRVKIHQGVTIGRRDSPSDEERNVPPIEIGDDTIIGAGAKILATNHMRIGKRCFIGANAVVISDVPDDSIAVGVPARILPANREERKAA